MAKKKKAIRKVMPPSEPDEEPLPEPWRASLPKPFEDPPPEPWRKSSPEPFEEPPPEPLEEPLEEPSAEPLVEPPAEPKRPTEFQNHCRETSMGLSTTSGGLPSRPWIS